jgi:hypothetical protein
MDCTSRQKKVYTFNPAIPCQSYSGAAYHAIIQLAPKIRLMAVMHLGLVVLGFTIPIHEQDTRILTRHIRLVRLKHIGVNGFNSQDAPSHHYGAYNNEQPHGIKSCTTRHDPSTPLPTRVTPSAENQQYTASISLDVVINSEIEQRKNDYSFMNQSLGLRGGRCTTIKDYDVTVREWNLKHWHVKSTYRSHSSAQCKGLWVLAGYDVDNYMNSIIKNRLINKGFF